MRSLEARIVALFAVLLPAIQFGAFVIAHVAGVALERRRPPQSARLPADNATFVEAIRSRERAKISRLEFGHRQAPQAGQREPRERTITAPLESGS